VTSRLRSHTCVRLDSDLSQPLTLAVVTCCKEAGTTACPRLFFLIERTDTHYRDFPAECLGVFPARSRFRSAARSSAAALTYNIGPPRDELSSHAVRSNGLFSGGRQWQEIARVFIRLLPLEAIIGINARGATLAPRRFTIIGIPIALKRPGSLTALTFHSRLTANRVTSPPE